MINGGYDFTVREIPFWLVLLIYVGASLYFIGRIIYNEDKVNWIKRKSKLLEALLEDYDQLGKKQDEVESRVRSFWDLEDLTKIHHQLRKAESKWVKSTGKVVSKAKGCVAEYNKQRQSTESIWDFITVFFRSKTINDVVRQIYDVESNLTDHFKKRDKEAKNIHMSMENSRSRSRSLLDQYTIQEEDKPVAKADSKSEAAQKPKQNKPSPSFDELMNKSIDLFSDMEDRLSIYLLLPLHAFLGDLSQLQLITETENQWRKVAEEMIKDVEIYIRNYLWWFKIFGILKKCKMSIPFFENRFRKEIKLVVTEFNKLLSYNLTFIDRAAEMPTFHSVTDYREITSVMESIDSKLKNMDKRSQQVEKIKSNYDTLKNMQKLLQEGEQTAGRDACAEQLKSIARELDNILQHYMTEPEANQSEIGNAINILQNLIKTCTIERQESTKVVGLKNEERDLVSKLTTRSGSNPNTLSIVGIKGVGKTTLAKIVYYNKDVVEHFPVRVWVTVTKGTVDKAKVLLMKKDGTIDQTLNLIRACDHLKEKLCLVVLDNVLERTDFDQLYQTLSGSGWTDGSRILLTTRFKNVASYADNSTTPHHIRLLTKEESWTLFQKVSSSQIPLELELEILARKVVGKCGGLPLSILSLGCVMSAMRITKDSLLEVLVQINHGHYKKHWLQWEEDKKELSKTVRDCLYYLTNFPVDYDIPARRLVNLWAGEGLVQQNNGKTPDDTAESYLEELRDRNMIQVGILKSNGKIKTCRLPSMLRELILEKSNTTSQGQYLGTHLEGRLSYHFHDRVPDANSSQAYSKNGIPRSVLFFDKREGSKPGEDVGKILSTGIASEQFLETRVLDLECIFRPKLPKTLSKFNNLKYLSLRWTYLEEFPLCICKLSELETLDLKHTCLQVISSSIWKLKKLKKLYMSQNNRGKIRGKPKGNFHENLLTLWGVFLYESYPLLGYLHMLKNLQNLKLAFQLRENDQVILVDNIVKLEQLHSLRLRSVNDTNRPEKLLLKNMSNLGKLSSLQLFGQLKDRLRASHLPKNLTDLTLSASELKDDPMPELQNLNKLKSLCFYADSYMGKKMVCPPESFQQLQVLRFWNLENLQEWEVKEGAMSSLIEFEARSCINLEFAIGLKHLKTIQMIKLHKMKHIFGIDIKKTLVNVEIYED